MITIAQIGCGYWGPNLLRNLSTNPKCHVKWVAEESPQRRTYIETNFPKTQITANWEDIVNDPEVDGVVIATPASTHYQLTKAVLKAGKHALVEKPLAMSTPEADELIYSKRLNLGQIRSDVNAWWNLAPHDISILLYLMNGELPSSVTAHGIDYIQPGIEDVVFATLTWENKVTAHIHVSWLDPGKIRQMTLVGSKKMLIYDDVSDDKIKILDKGIDRLPKIGERMDYDNVNNYQLLQRTGDILLPKINFQEPLKIEIIHFLECISENKESLTGKKHARDVVAILEAGQQSLKTGIAVKSN